MIKLTQWGDRQPIYINYKHIDAVYAEGARTGVEYGEHYAEVVEAVDEVLEAIQTKKLAETLRNEFAGLR